MQPQVPLSHQSVRFPYILLLLRQVEIRSFGKSVVLTASQSDNLNRSSELKQERAPFERQDFAT